jgi:hypothetical protein
LEKREEKIIRVSLNSLDEFNELETREQKKHKEETKREALLPVSAGKTLALANSLLVYSLVDLPNPFDNPGFVASLANYNPLDLF